MSGKPPPGRSVVADEPPGPTPPAVLYSCARRAVRSDPLRALLRSPVAQLAEQPAVNRQVFGSSPNGGASYFTTTPTGIWWASLVSHQIRPAARRRAFSGRHPANASTLVRVDPATTAGGWDVRKLEDRLGRARPSEAAARHNQGTRRTPCPLTTDVVIVGGGLAGLAAARRLHRAGVSWRLVEAADRLGGRVATDTVDGFLLDRGFQVLNTAYPRLGALLDVDRLDLGFFVPGVRVRKGDRLLRLVNPLREPAGGPGTALAPVGSLPDRLRFAALAASYATLPPERLLARPETTAEVALRARASPTGSSRTCFVRSSPACCSTGNWPPPATSWRWCCARSPGAGSACPPTAWRRCPGRRRRCRPGCWSCTLPSPR